MDHHVHLARELSEVLLAKAQRRGVHVALQDSHLLCDVLLEAVAELLAQAAEGGGAEHVLLEALGRALLAGGPDDEVQASEVGTERRIFSTSAVPRKPVPPVSSTFLSRYASPST